ncbi:hypothetical protein QIT81_gp48 [Pseudomonas phage MR15]|uniref:Uncharacterized protein n=1 Tax=Pseudomonas phage MR15 TaxID=2711179 RepID=A0A6M3TE24_9CAUD|nr:hypothetical protein QIT81_gp48 [Pseudomonas phage MR15]QJD55109.1 hypothetical protein Psm1vBMR13_gp47c [Pseudomonas phage MR13]QJD55262.1 hypothetical protein Psm1vBMR15_gp48c [Pseudomonas phage MR15]
MRATNSRSHASSGTGRDFHMRSRETTQPNWQSIGHEMCCRQ